MSHLLRSVLTWSSRWWWWTLSDSGFLKWNYLYFDLFWQITILSMNRWTLSLRHKLLPLLMFVFRGICWTQQKCTEYFPDSSFNDSPCFPPQTKWCYITTTTSVSLSSHRPNHTDMSGFLTAAAIQSVQIWIIYLLLKMSFAEEEEFHSSPLMEK